MNIPFVSIGKQFEPLKEEFIQVFKEIGASGQYIMGEALEDFENEIANYCETKYALGLANGSDALFLALKAMNIGEGDEVITCPNSFIASAWVIESTKAKTVFVDCSEDYNIDVNKIEDAITSKTKAILPVHLTGRPAHMDEINNIAKKNKTVQPTLLFLGRLKRYKRVDLVIEAVARLGYAKYAGLAGMPPVAQFVGALDNLLGVRSPDRVRRRFHPCPRRRRHAR